MVIAESDRDLFALCLTIKRKVMRKYLQFLVFTILLCTSCAKDNLYKDALMGTWKLQQIKQNEEWVGVSKNPSLQITLTIRPDGSYSTNGYLGNVSGTWHLSKRNLTFYVGEQEYIKCYVTELWWEYCELQFTLNNETIYTKFKCNKK